MLSFYELYTRVTTILSDTSSGTTTLAKDLINDAYKEAVNLCGIDDDAQTILIGVANHNSYRLPASLRKLRTVQVITTSTSGTATSTSAGNLVDAGATFTQSMVGNFVYNKTDNTYTVITALNSATSVAVQDDIFASGETYEVGDGDIYNSTEIVNENEWNFINQSNVYVSTDVINNHFIRGRNLEIYPTQNSSNNFIVLSHTKLIKDLTADDYTTGTVTIAKGSTTVTGSGTTFTSAMVGRYFKVSGEWYRIKSFTSTTILTLEERFEDTTASASTYTIGELPVIPEVFHRSLTYLPLSEMYLRTEQASYAEIFDKKWRDAKKDMMKFGSSKSEGLEVQLPTGRFTFIDSSKDRLVTIV